MMQLPLEFLCSLNCIALYIALPQHVLGLIKLSRYKIHNVTLYSFLYMFAGSL